MSYTYNSIVQLCIVGTTQKSCSSKMNGSEEVANQLGLISLLANAGEREKALEKTPTELSLTLQLPLLRTVLT